MGVSSHIDVQALAHTVSCIYVGIVPNEHMQFDEHMAWYEDKDQHEHRIRNVYTQTYECSPYYVYRLLL